MLYIVAFKYPAYVIGRMIVKSAVVVATQEMVKIYIRHRIPRGEIPSGADSPDQYQYQGAGEVVYRLAPILRRHDDLDEHSP